MIFISHLQGGEQLWREEEKIGPLGVWHVESMYRKLLKMYLQCNRWPYSLQQQESGWSQCLQNKEERIKDLETQDVRALCDNFIAAVSRETWLDNPSSNKPQALQYVLWPDVPYDSQHPLISCPVFNHRWSLNDDFCSVKLFCETKLEDAEQKLLKQGKVKVSPVATTSFSRVVVVWLKVGHRRNLLFATNLLWCSRNLLPYECVHVTSMNRLADEPVNPELVTKCKSDVSVMISRCQVCS